MNLQSESVAQAGNDSDELDCQCSSAVTAPEINNSTWGSSDNWMVLSISGDKPVPRFNVIDCSLILLNFFLLD